MSILTPQPHKKSCLNIVKLAEIYNTKIHNNWLEKRKHIQASGQDTQPHKVEMDTKIKDIYPFLDNVNSLLLEARLLVYSLAPSLNIELF